MMSGLSRLRSALKAARQLGLHQTSLYAFYRILLKSGYLRRVTPASSIAKHSSGSRLQTGLFPIPEREFYSTWMQSDSRKRLLEQADEVVAGQVRLFGGKLYPLELAQTYPLRHWTELEQDPPPAEKLPLQDIKLLWEPGRFGWAVVLGRAYYLSADEKYARAFWMHTQVFLEANPANLGPHWMSAQEVALRLIALVFAYHLFETSSQTTPERGAMLAEAVSAHASRIPPTLIYARAQNNNHLLTEACGLLTAALALPDHPQANSWLDTGWHWFNNALQNQIAPDGAYVQHSSNYHRLMLQAALWGALLVHNAGLKLPQPTLTRLESATRWLQALIDPESGEAPNLGPNDGAYILPLTTQPFKDYRPVLQAAGQAFLEDTLLQPGPWDEMALWLAPALTPARARKPAAQAPAPCCLLHSPGGSSWAYLRTARFESRPGHADLLHLDLWWRGINVARDPGTYLYNAPHPWDNSLSAARMHNTVTVDGKDQMLRAGRFLYLDWAQSRLVSRYRSPGGDWEQLTASHDGYRQLGLCHSRTVTASEADRWLVEDVIEPLAGRQPTASRSIRLHWLLPDWPHEVLAQELAGKITLRLSSPGGWIELHIRVDVPEGAIPQFQLARAGEKIAGQGQVEPADGWFSPTYAEKQTALSLAITVQAELPVKLRSEWLFPTRITASTIKGS